MAYATLPTEALVEELDKLKERVRYRDQKMQKRLRHPMVHAHPSQFWPIVAEAYNLGFTNHALYFRWYDWITGPMAGAVAGVIVFEAPMRWYYPHNYWMKGLYWRKWPWVAGFTVLAYLNKANMVECRMFGLDENDDEIAKYGPMYPEEIEEAAARKKRYEQEYIRIKEGLFDAGQITERIDTIQSYFYDSAAPGLSGYFSEQMNKKKLMDAERERMKTQNASSA
ncbi:hypothetical protein DIPPA_03556 [Diplonema papillatum]|nr:hypothetical protein DIPPA_03556 [Diplonema papillatum]